MLKKGLYEQIINKALDEELSHSEDLSQTAPIDEAEASKVLSRYLAMVAEKELSHLQDRGGSVNDQIGVVNRTIRALLPADSSEKEAASVAERAEQLLALIGGKDSISAIDANKTLPRPETSIAQTSLFTGAL